MERATCFCTSSRPPSATVSKQLLALPIHAKHPTQTRHTKTSQAHSGIALPEELYERNRNEANSGTITGVTQIHSQHRPLGCRFLGPCGPGNDCRVAVFPFDSLHVPVGDPGPAIVPRNGQPKGPAACCEGVVGQNQGAVPKTCHINSCQAECSHPSALLPPERGQSGCGCGCVGKGGRGGGGVVPLDVSLELNTFFAESCSTK